MGKGTPEIRIEPNPRRVVVTVHGRTIADTRRALALGVPGMPADQYIPREDVDMTALRRTTHRTHCPYKGDAAYYTIEVAGHVAEDAVWTYETPRSGVAAIKDHLAFYRDRVDAIEERD